MRGMIEEITFDGKRERIRDDERVSIDATLHEAHNLEGMDHLFSKTSRTMIVSIATLTSMLPPRRACMTILMRATAEMFTWENQIKIR